MLLPELVVVKVVWWNIVLQQSFLKRKR